MFVSMVIIQYYSQAIQTKTETTPTKTKIWKKWQQNSSLRKKNSEEINIRLSTHPSIQTKQERKKQED